MSAYLQKKLAQLNDEMRHYPRPIARCDEQLTALIEERAGLLRELEKESCSAEALWVNDGGFNAA